MAIIQFFEKPGCNGNLQQKRILEKAGHTVVAHNLLTERWTAAGLLKFLAPLPVKKWFNPNAPMVKSGAILPETLDAESALNLLLADPILIRRPLLEANGHREVGFDLQRISAWLGLGGSDDLRPAEICAHKRPCPAPDET